MNPRIPRSSRSHSWFSKLALAAGLTVAAGVFSAPAFAHGPQIGIAVNFPVPGFISPWDADRFAPYFAARVAIGPQLQIVYRFPVETPYGVVYRPYAYCDGRLVGLAVGPAYGGRWDDRRFDRPWHRDRYERYERHERWERNRDRHEDREYREYRNRERERDRDRGRDDRDGWRDRRDRD